MLRYLCISGVAIVLAQAQQDEQCEDVALLQRKIAPACVNGALQHNYCLCSLGWSGPSCEKPEELGSGSDSITVASSDSSSKKCGALHPYPYSEQKNWGTNYYSWEACKGKSQSPVVIWTATTKNKKGKGLKWKYERRNNLNVGNNGHFIEVKSDFGNLTIGREVFNFGNFHFHTPSEHKINWWRAPVEMHIVNQAADGTAAVIGILFEIGEENKCLKKVLENPAIAGCSKPLESFDLSCMGHIMDGPYWRYTGSLTTPPCSEIVTWNVMQKMATMSYQQWQALKGRYPAGNSRHVQPLFGRKITSVCD